MSDMRICSWNANGLRNKVAELTYFLSNNRIDIMMISETRLNSSIKLKIRNYQAIRKDKDSNSGGIVILVKNGVPFKEVKISDKIAIENIGIKLASNIHVIAVYNSPSREFTTQELEGLLNVGNRVVVMGDMNARHTSWNCHTNNTAGRVLYNYSLKNNCSILFPDEPTHYPVNGTTPSTIDIGINKNVTGISNMHTVQDLSSDHNPIILILGSQHKSTSERKIYDYEKAEWEKVRRILNSKVKITNKISTEEEIDKEVQKLTRNIQEAITKSIPLSTTKVIQDRLPNNILNMISDRNRLRKRWQRTRLTSIKEEVKIRTKEIRAAIYEHRNEIWTNKLKKINIHDKSLWRMTKIFKTERQQVATLTKNTEEAITDAEKANMLATQFESVHNINLTNNSITQEKIIKEVNTYIKETASDDWTKYTTTPKEIVQIIKKLPAKKAPGSDNIQNIVLKNLERKTIVQITHIINTMIKLSHFPAHWKTSNIIPLLKAGKNKTDPGSYRPISLLQTLGKLTEKIIAKRLNDYEQSNKIIVDQQFGFRERHNTVQQVVRIVNDIATNFNKNNVTVMLLLDIEKAFDRVWIDGLIYKMIQHKYPIVLTKLINSYLRNRKLQVNINSSTSSKKKIRAGVPQGSVLGPKLFNIYLNDLPTFPKTKLALFADDTAIYAHSFNAIVAAKQIQIHLNILQEYYTEWKIALNESKTEVIVFAKKTKNRKIIQPIKVYNHTTQPTHTVKYLGVHLDSKLLYTEHFKQTLRKAYAMQKKLYPLMVSSSKVSPRNKKLIYTMILRPIITYAAAVWCSAAPTNIKPLQLYQNKCLRLILTENRDAKVKDMHKKAEVQEILEYTKILAENFYRTQLSSNPLLKRITEIRSHNQQNRIKHKLPYQALKIYHE